VESSCEFGIEASGSMKCWDNFGVSKQLGISRVVLSSIKLVIHQRFLENMIKKLRVPGRGRNQGI
jgi:hypothetical protein